jgi:hypothetical protein
MYAPAKYLGYSLNYIINTILGHRVGFSLPINTPSNMSVGDAEEFLTRG